MNHPVAALHARDLELSFGSVRVLRALSVSVPPGLVTVLLGANGVGKSTLLRLALGTLRPTAGGLTVLGRDPVREARAVRERVGYVPDTPDAYAWMTPRQFYRFLAPQYPTWSHKVQAEHSATLGVPLDTRFGELSRGQGTKAMLVAALAPEPELLLLDEPFAGLDPLAREQVLRTVIDSLREDGRTILCATHDLDVAASIADRVAVLAGGQVATHGTVEEVLGTEQPTHIPTRLAHTLALAEAR